jgi:hypothetical protein
MEKKMDKLFTQFKKKKKKVKNSVKAMFDGDYDTIKAVVLNPKGLLRDVGKRNKKLKAAAGLK